jgi:hypothetical protein
MPARSSFLIAIVFFLLHFYSADARVWLLQPDGSGDAATIAAAIDSAATNGDVIVLADGIYTGEGNRDLSNGEKWFLIKSQSGDPTTCIIDLQGSADDPHWGIIYVDGG